ncbi:DNA-binding LytR/AlgR family response regulator [Sedimentibacter acidaminivorans]|jgi:DNA-binding LytR/AlgR family response regulator|uniref:DNA-binding LytR/AlgR family response regulator n=1 Tax=Sedimentibacter acidaminivorans TaxID=913099 RepID=A0ABS4GHS6_9FIRM|nr:LytTR family DNA-binding domain-containing protein [Sedimentibacter acidaminivorans]MBP1926925.1 DNA-binding LytR/AlgR family response regulator [Sedimentibacter acidaminivorans]
MIKIAICDDELQELERAHDFLAKYIQKKPQYDIQIVTFSAPLELLSYVEKNGSFDIFLLDVYMAGMLGTDAARELRQIDDKGEIIFVTSSRDHAIDAFEVDAANYLIKPYTESNIISALDKVLKRLKVERRHMITLKTSEGIVRIFLRDVVYTETGRNNYQTIHTITGEKIMVRMTATELFDLLLPAKFFVRCGVSINLNLKHIRQIRKDTIIFDSGEHLTYPYRAYKKLKEAFLSFQMSTEV